jgi:membrane protease subunit HflK
MDTDAMQQVYSNVTKVLVDTRNGGSNLLYLPLDKLMQAAGAAQPATSSPSSSTTLPSAPPPASSAADRGGDAARSRDRESR